MPRDRPRHARPGNPSANALLWLVSIVLGSLSRPLGQFAQVAGCPGITTPGVELVGEVSHRHPGLLPCELHLHRGERFKKVSHLIRIRPVGHRKTAAAQRVIRRRQPFAVLENSTERVRAARCAATRSRSVAVFSTGIGHAASSRPSRSRATQTRPRPHPRARGDEPTSTAAVEVSDHRSCRPIRRLACSCVVRIERSLMEPNMHGPRLTY